MELYRYPILCWRMGPDHICGHLIGTDYNWVASDVRKIKASLSDRISREYQREGWFQEPLLSPQLKQVEVECTPSYQEDDGLYPAPYSLKLQVPTVSGETEYGHSICYLPLFQQSFFYYNPKQLVDLARHFTQDIIAKLTPEEVHRYLLPATPWLEEAVVRVNESSRRSRHNFGPTRHEKTLSGMAERFPSRHSTRKNASPVPDVAWERTSWVDTIVTRLLEEQANILVVGDSGVGKSAVLREAAKKASKMSRSEESNTLYFWKTSPHRIMAGARYLGDWQKNCEQMIEAIRSSGGYLWFTDFVELVRTGGEGAEDSIAAFLTPALRNGSIRIVGETTSRQLEAIRVMLPGFVELFQIIKVPEMEKPSVQRVLQHFQAYTSRNMNIEFTQEALELTYRLLSRFERRESFPGKAMKFLGQCLNRAYLEQTETIDSPDVLKLFVENTGLPELFLRDDLLLDEAEMQSFFTSSIIGQENALEALYRIVKVFKAGLNDPNKPIATLLFAGPTGVGKTACVKTLADYFFGKGQSTNPLIRLDMSEFQHPMQLERLVGSGHGEPGKLIQQVRDKPFSVVLLDEIEKAHSSVFDILLAVLDEGILYDAFGRRTDFCNTIIIMTSNLGVGSNKSVGFSRNTETNFTSSVRSFFRPEFFNRIDAVVTFSHLTPENIQAITTKELADISQREGLRKRGLTLQTSDALVAHLADIGYDKDYGARPLQRVVERVVVAALANYLSEHPKAQNQTLQLDWRNEAVTVTPR